METLIVLILAFAPSVWVSPIAHDPESENDWFRCEMAYDDAAHTFAYEKTASARKPLDLLFAYPVNAGSWSVSLWGEFGTMDSFELWLFYDNKWNLHWDGIANSAGPSNGVTKARIVSNYLDHSLCVLDVRLKETPEPATLALLGLGTLFFYRTKPPLSKGAEA